MTETTNGKNMPLNVDPKQSENENQLVDFSEKRSRSKKRNILRVFTFSLIVLGIVWFLLWFFSLRFYQSTDDAYANGNLININATVPGSVVVFYADDTDLVEEGQLLVELDKTSYQVQYDKSLASLASAVLKVRELQDTVLSNQASVEIKQIAAKKASYDLENRFQLVDSLAVSNEEFTHSKDELASAEQQLKKAEAELKVSLDAIGNTSLEDHPLIDQEKANVRIAYYNLKHCSIYAPARGYVAKRAVDVGEWVTQNTPLMTVIPTDYVWVDANFKETQLPYMRIGQPATVHFDYYGSKVKFYGKVLGIASGSGSVFSLIPPQNATGNWIKIVQRLAVRISLDPETVKKYPVRIGISADVGVDISNQDLPYLAAMPNTKPIAKTIVFDINIAEVNKVIDEVIKANLKKEQQ